MGNRWQMGTKEALKFETIYCHLLPVIFGARMSPFNHLKSILTLTYVALPCCYSSGIHLGRKGFFCMVPLSCMLALVCWYRMAWLRYCADLYPYLGDKKQDWERCTRWAVATGQRSEGARHGLMPQNPKVPRNPGWKMLAQRLRKSTSLLLETLASVLKPSHFTALFLHIFKAYPLCEDFILSSLRLSCHE